MNWYRHPYTHLCVTIECKFHRILYICYLAAAEFDNFKLIPEH